MSAGSGEIVSRSALISEWSSHRVKPVTRVPTGNLGLADWTTSPVAGAETAAPTGIGGKYSESAFIQVRCAGISEKVLLRTSTSPVWSGTSLSGVSRYSKLAG